MAEDIGIIDSNAADDSGASDGDKGDQQASEIVTELTKEQVVNNELAAKFLEVIDANEADKAILLDAYPELKKLLEHYNEYVENYPGQGSVYAINIANEIQEGNLHLNLADNAFDTNYAQVERDMFSQRQIIEQRQQDEAAAGLLLQKEAYREYAESMGGLQPSLEEHAMTQKSQIPQEAPVISAQEKEPGAELFPDRREKLYKAISLPGMAKEIAGDDKDILVALAFYQSVAQGTRGDGLTDANEQIMLDRIKENLGDMLESNDRASIKNLQANINQQVIDARELQAQQQLTQEQEQQQ
jgi:hypothetical protein